MASQDTNEAARPGTVRFQAQDEEIPPAQALEHVETITNKKGANTEGLDEKAVEELKNLSITMQKSRLQSKRLENFTFEPVSLPPSRAHSPSGSSRSASRVVSRTQNQSSPQLNALHSPPLTPAATTTKDGKPRPGSSSLRENTDQAMVTPQTSPPHEPPPTSIEAVQERGRDAQAREGPHEQPREKESKATSDIPAAVAAHPKHAPNYSVGPTGDSLPPSRDASPGRSGTTSPGATTGTSTPVYSRPFTPSGDTDNPYARSKRLPEPRNRESVDHRFIFGKNEGRRHGHSPSSSSATLGVPAQPDNRAKAAKRSSGFFGGRHHDASEVKDGAHTEKEKEHHHGSMSELKRFFRFGHKKDKEPKKSSRPSSRAVSRAQSPAPSVKAVGTASPTPAAMPFADDHGLQGKYGKFGKVLGSGAGGSVRLMKRSSDGTTFAVKQFRSRHSYESEKEYTKKVTGEFCIGSTLHHGNIIETMDLVHEKGSWYVVMEYAPFDLFAIVMTGKMSRDEVSCATLQILSGVTYLHSMGLAHRDLKLDNVVVNEHGIMKIIDFGSAAVFRYPFENEIVLASGIVGSDPYLAPEVYDKSKYDPQPTDIWSIAIIFCCMTLRRFPWKQPRVSDNSYKLFVSAPEGGPSRGSVDAGVPTGQDGSASAPTSRHHTEQTEKDSKSEPATHEGSTVNAAEAGSQQAPNGDKAGAPQVIKGPWRLLRLLPRESRYIIGRMLEIDPTKRAKMQEILDDKWVANSHVCRQEEGGQIVRAPGHEHTLEPGAGGDSNGASKK